MRVLPARNFALGLGTPVKRIAPRAAGVELKTGRLTPLGLGLEKAQPVHIGPEDALLADLTAHHVIDGLRILHAKTARHARKPIGPSAMRPESCLTPLGCA